MPTEANLRFLVQSSSVGIKQLNVFMFSCFDYKGIFAPCGQCDHRATCSGNLLTHIKSKHEGFRYPCDQCDYKATQRANLKSHIQSQHEGVKYPCSECDYKAQRGVN